MLKIIAFGLCSISSLIQMFLAVIGYKQKNYLSTLIAALVFWIIAYFAFINNNIWCALVITLLWFMGLMEFKNKKVSLLGIVYFIIICWATFQIGKGI